MAEKKTGIFEKLGVISSVVKWIVSILFIVFIFVLGANIYPILKDCWTCDVFRDMYNIFGKIGLTTFDFFQNYVLIVVSVCLALWIAYKTFEALSPTLDAMLYPDAPKFDDNFIKTIYKKMFLTVAVLGLFILNEPRNIFANTFEITLDFGSSIGRTLVRDKIIKLIKLDEIPDECKDENQSTELEYEEGSVLSNNTRDNIICLMKEVNILRHNYINLGIEMFEYGLGPMISVFVEAVVIRVAAFVVGIVVGKLGPKVISKKLGKKIGKLKDKIAKKFANGKGAKRLTKALDKLEENIDDIAKKKAKQQKKFINEAGKIGGLASIIINFFTEEDVRIGVGGIALIIGFIMINVLFGFIFVESMLFLGVTIILLPILVACYIFHDVGGLGNFATKGLSDTFSFALRIIFTCIAMVICAELNDWILGGMFGHEGDNITVPKTLISFLKNDDLKSFSHAVSPYYLAYIFLALYFNFTIISQSGKFAKWFGAEIKDSSLAKPLVGLGKSTLKSVTSVTRELKHYRKYGNTKGGLKGEKFGGFVSGVKELPGNIKKIPGNIKSKFLGIFHGGNK